MTATIVGFIKAFRPKKPWQRTEKYKKMTPAERVKEANKRTREKRERHKQLRK